VQRRDELLDVLDLEQSALVLVMGSPRIRSPTLWRLAVAEVEELGLLGSAMSSQSEHCWSLPWWSAWAACAWGYLSLRNIGDLGRAENPPIR
jgi:hypothetical protein